MKKIQAAALVGILGFSGNAMAAGGNNHAAVFAGVTGSDGNNETTVGVEYEYRTNLYQDMIGVGAAFENIMSDPSATVIVAGLVIHPGYDLKVNLMYGQESVSGHTANVTRIGIGYDYHVPNTSYSVGVAYNRDDIEGHGVNVMGVAVGMGF